MADITMPQLGETVTEGTITRWMKQVGDEVAEDEVLFEVSTDKVDSEVPSPAAGVVSEILVPEGETVDVGTRLAVISDGAAATAPSSGADTAGDDAAGDDAAGDDTAGSAEDAEVAEAVEEAADGGASSDDAGAGVAGEPARDAESCPHTPAAKQEEKRNKGACLFYPSPRPREP
ncbi:MAG: biotin/lipoyl-containing protein, partial [Acidimicrobiales bacterium]